MEAVNKARGKGDAVACRKLSSGDVVVVFTVESTELDIDAAWVCKVFGDDARISRREVIVLAKGIPTKQLQEAYDEKTLVAAL